MIFSVIWKLRAFLLLFSGGVLDVINLQDNWIRLPLCLLKKGAESVYVWGIKFVIPSVICCKYINKDQVFCYDISLHLSILTLVRDWAMKGNGCPYQVDVTNYFPSQLLNYIPCKWVCSVVDQIISVIGSFSNFLRLPKVPKAIKYVWDN